MQKTFKTITILILAFIAAIGASRTYGFDLFELNFNFAIVLTILTLNLSVLTTLFFKAKIARLPITAVFLLLFFVYTIFSSLFASQNIFFIDKFLWFMFFTFSGILIILLIEWNEVSIKAFFDTLVRISFFSILVYLSATWMDSFPFREKILDSYLGFSRAAILGVAFSAISLFFFKARPLFFVHLVFFLVFALSSGSRGSLVAFLLAVVVMAALFLIRSQFFIRFVKRFFKILTLFVISPLILGLSLGLFSSSSEIVESSRTIQRLSILFEERDGGTSGGGRLDRIGASISYLAAAEPDKVIFGCGFSCWSSAVKDIEVEPVRDYPHVLILEILVEMGIVGLMLFCVTLWLLVLHVKVGLFKDINMTSLFFITLLLFFWSFLSGDLNDNFSLFWFVLISTFYSNKRFQSERSIASKLQKFKFPRVSVARSGNV